MRRVLNSSFEILPSPSESSSRTRSATSSTSTSERILSVSTNSALLYADNLPANTPGLFYYGTSAVEIPFGDGLRCAGGNVSRMNPALFTSPQGDVARPLDFNASPLSAQAIGDTIVIQLWYRDNAAGASGFNLSDALIAILCP